jgi:hypothetical protein
MRTAALLVALAGLTTLSCMETLPSTTALPPVREEVWFRSPSGASPIRAAFQVTEGVARGHLDWAANCERVLLVRAREQELEETKPNYEAGLVAGMGALGAAAGGAALFGNLDQFSTKEACHTDEEGDVSCSSPRDDATVGGVLLVATAIGLTVASIATVTSSSSTTYGEVRTGEIRERRVLAENAACGQGAVAGVALSLYLAEERIAASVTDEHGNVAFSLPANVTGTLTVKVDSAPRGYGVVKPGQAVGALRIEPRPAPSETVPW